MEEGEKSRHERRLFRRVHATFNRKGESGRREEESPAAKNGGHRGAEESKAKEHVEMNLGDRLSIECPAVRKIYRKKEGRDAQDATKGKFEAPEESP